MNNHHQSGSLVAASHDEVRGYLDDLAELELDEAQKLEFLGVLFGIMRTFVELGFDTRHCGQLLEAFNEVTTSESAALDSLNAEKEEEA